MPGAEPFIQLHTAPHTYPNDEQHLNANVGIPNVLVKLLLSTVVVVAAVGVALFGLIYFLVLVQCDFV